MRSRAHPRGTGEGPPHCGPGGTADRLNPYRPPAGRFVRLVPPVHQPWSRPASSRPSGTFPRSPSHRNPSSGSGPALARAMSLPCELQPLLRCRWPSCPVGSTASIGALLLVEPRPYCLAVGCGWGLSVGASARSSCLSPDKGSSPTVVRFKSVTLQAAASPAWACHAGAIGGFPRPQKRPYRETKS